MEGFWYNKYRILNKTAYSMNLQQRVKNAAQALTGKTSNSLDTAEAKKFLRYGNGTKPLMSNWSDVKMSDEDMYTGYSYAAIVKRANRTSVLGRRFIITEASQKTMDEYTNKEEKLIHPYLKVINRSKDFTKKMFWYEISTYLDLEGIYYLGAVRNSSTANDGSTFVGNIQKFVLINPYEIKKVINETTGEIGGYVESHNGFYREWAPEQIVEIKMLNPFNKDKPYAMTDAAKESQFTMKQAGDYTRQTINGNLASPGIVTTSVELDEQQFANFKDRVRNRQKGEPIFGNGAGSLNWQDMQIDLDKAALDKVNEIQRSILFAVSGTSKTTLGIEESGTTRDTSQTQDDNFTVDAIIPRVEDICDALNLDYRKWYPEWEDNEFEIVVDNPLESDRDAEVKDIEIRDAAFDLAQKLIDKGYDREHAFKYAFGDISWDELPEPEVVEPIQPIVPPAATPPVDQTPIEEPGITPTDTTKQEPAPQNGANNAALSAIGQDHHSISPAGLILAENALDGETRDIMKAQENKLKDGIANLEKDIVGAAVDRISKNYLEESNEVVSKTEQKQFEKDLAALLVVFYINLFPLFGRQLLAQRAAEYGEIVPYEVTKDAQNYIDKMATQASVSHVDTVISDILKAAQIAYAAATIDALVQKLQEEVSAGNEEIISKIGKDTTEAGIRKAAEAGKFDDTSIYKEAQRLARQGEGRDSIARAIRKQYQTISENRATTIARTEAARVFNQSQYEADRQFLNRTGLMNKAYKTLRSRTGHPCSHCQGLINQAPIPFETNFADLGTQLTATETDEKGNVKVKTLPISYEAVSAGNVHPNCSCEYVLVIKD